MTIIIKGLNNPPYVIKNSQDFEIWDENDKIAAKEQITFAFHPGTLLANISSASELAGEVSTFTFSFQITHQILKGGYLMVFFPFFNQNSGAKEYEKLSCLSSSTDIKILNIKVN